MKEQVLQLIANALANNMGNRITTELIHGVLVVVGQSISDPPVAEPTETVS